MAKYRRNDPCPCGSGKKYKHCCLNKIIPFSEQISNNEVVNAFSEYQDITEKWHPELLFPDNEEEDLMPKYDPEIQPDKDEWLSLDEMERIIMVSEYHERKKVDLPDIQLHAASHAVVENQLAENIPEVVAALQRLMSEGLDRHEAIHAIGSVLAGHIYRILKHKPVMKDPNKPYLKELNSLSAEEWINECEDAEE